MSSVLGSLGKGLVQIRTQGMQSMNNCITSFILYGFLYRLKSITSTLKPPFTHVHDHEKLLPHLARNNASINNSDKNEKKYIETRQNAEVKQSFVTGRAWRTEFKGHFPIQGTDSDRTFEKWAEKVCFHLFWFAKQPFPRFISSVPGGACTLSQFCISTHAYFGYNLQVFDCIWGLLYGRRYMLGIINLTNASK